MKTFILLSMIFLEACLSCGRLHAVPIRVLAWDDEIAAMHLGIVDSKGVTAIEGMHPSTRTKPYQVVAGEEPLRIQISDRKDREGNPLTSEIKMGKGVRQPLLVILPDGKSSAGIRLFVLEDDTANFAWGSFRFINATGKPIVYVCEKKVVALPPSWTPVQNNPGGESRNMEVKFYFRENSSNPISSSIWEYSPDERILVFLVPGNDPRLGPVAVKIISEDRTLENASAVESADTP